MELKTKYEDDLTSIELRALGAPMAYIAFNINMIFMEPYKKKLNIKHTLQDLMDRISQRIYITNQCLGTMTSPAESGFQELTYRECIKRIRELASEASADIRDIEDNHEESTDVSKKIKDSKASL